ncbi:alpha/beta hydrolase [uncultured Paenibacillus sp.]|uniref:alpha/beta hydrolase n=1 Tax=uncultured Paenibacillus sp. TaxID=227322 RepID=UPI0015AB03C1|nr:alpha/beta hydrolase-fold protein [uncultured Paenibacillus sp.]
MSQVGKRQPFRIPGAEQWTMTSRSGRNYRIMLWKPDTEAPEGGFPVIYMLDANACFGAMTEAVRMHARGPHRLETAVVVGIGYEGDQPFATEHRFYDYTIQAAADELPERKMDAPWPETGGADYFLRFIEEELKPAIEREVPIDRQRQALFGHSLGGWFTLYTLFMRTRAFQVYAAGSPSIWWKNHYLLPVAKRWLNDRELLNAQAEIPLRIFLGIGGLEKPHMVQDAKVMSELLASGIAGLNPEIYQYEEETHLSVIFPFIVRVVRNFLNPM